MGFASGVDVGGAFTDGITIEEGGRIVSAKSPSTPTDYSEGVFKASALLNALMMGKVPAVGFTTVGSVFSGVVVGAMQLAAQLGHRDVMATDVSGTPFQAGLIVGGEPVRAAKTIIQQSSVNVPALRVEALGSGDEAIAWIDPWGHPAGGAAERASIAPAGLIWRRRYRVHPQSRARHPARARPSGRPPAAVGRAGARHDQAAQELWAACAARVLSVKASSTLAVAQAPRGACLP